MEEGDTIGLKRGREEGSESEGEPEGEWVRGREVNESGGV